MDLSFCMLNFKLVMFDVSLESDSGHACLIGSRLLKLVSGVVPEDLSINMGFYDWFYYAFRLE